jgi:hypothetical protein
MPKGIYPRPAPKERSCSIPGCGKKAVARGWCRQHYSRWHRWGSPEALNEIPRGARSPHWQGDEIDYPAAHKRVKTLRGLANEHACRHCGGPATDWAYDHADQNELTNQRGAPYSLDPARYMPLCKSCHKKHDHQYVGCCPHGHPRTPENTFVDRRGWRSCRPCRREADRRYREKRRS